MNTNRLILFAFSLSSFMLLSSCGNEDLNIAKKYSESTVNDFPEAISVNFTPKDDSWKKLSLREKIGQTMIIRLYYDEHISQFETIENMMKEYPVGGIFVPDWKFSVVRPKENIASNIREKVKEYEDASRYSLIVSEDFERGVGYMYGDFTHMPAEMALGAANNTDLSYNFGYNVARESKSLGFNWLLHPVVDLNMNPLQNLVIERSISDDANRAYPLLKSQIKGMNDAGIVATIKHFPGDGATMKNQHFITSANNLSMSEWKGSFGTLFQNLINDGAPCIMVGHIRFPAYQKETINGIIPPATLSRELMQDLLKDKMKFNGVIISDALNMGGVGGYYKNEMETAVESFKAGVDLVLWPALSYMDTIEARINRGEIPMSRLDDAVERIWGVREKFGLLKKKDNLFDAMTEKDIAKIKSTTQEIANNAVTLLADNNNEIPLNPTNSKRILIVNLSHNDMRKDLRYTAKLLREKGFTVDKMLHNPIFFDWQDKLDFFEKYDKVIVAFENRYFHPLGASMLKDEEALGLWTMGMIPQSKIIAISYSNPYYVNFYFDSAPIRINAYSIDKFSQKAVVDALTGVIPFKGTSPVKLEFDFFR